MLLQVVLSFHQIPIPEWLTGLVGLVPLLLSFTIPAGCIGVGASPGCRKAATETP